LDPVSALVVIALVAAIVLCAVGVWAAIETARTARQVRDSAQQATTRVVPLLDKADVTVDAINAELLRIDAIITQFEEAGARVTHASDTLSDIVNTPAEIVSDVAGRVRRAWKDRKRTAEAESSSPAVDVEEAADSDERFGSDETVESDSGESDS